MGIVRASNIYVPNKNIDLKKWAVVACDQYTSEEEYWLDVEKIVGGEPSTLKIMYPEVYLEEAKDLKEKRLIQINKYMNEYISDGTLVTLEKSMVLVERQIGDRKRIGVVCEVDLDKYDYDLNVNPYIRATEQTIKDRIPPRLEIRKDAAIELPHILILIDDKSKSIIENLYKIKDDLEVVYDTELMKQGGHLKGFWVKDEALINEFCEKIEKNTRNNITMVVGDGNHSLATAKDHWRQIKATLSEEDAKNHPARYALVEIENIYDEGLDFFPIHRSLFGLDAEKFIKKYNEKISGKSSVRAYYKNKEFLLNSPEDSVESFKVIQEFIEEYLKENPDTSVDYIYGESNLKGVCDNKNGFGLIMNPIKKEELFPFVEKKQVLPKKTFSMGNAYEKRYYMECKKIKL